MKNKIIWITGFVDSGKTTIAKALQKKIEDSKYTSVVVLDAVELRRFVSFDLGYTNKDRKLNVLRAGGIAKILHDQGITVIVALISPCRADRVEVRKMFDEGDFIEVHNNTPIEVCAKRDTKGLYKTQKNPKFLDRIFRPSWFSLPGSKSSYEPPLNPEIVIDTSKSKIDQCVEYIYKKIYSNKKSK